MHDYDIIIIGAGPAGSSLASFMALNNKKVLLIEKEEYPRFHIGESLLPYSNEVFEKINFRKVMESGKYIQKNRAEFKHLKSKESIFFDFSLCGEDKFSYAWEVPREEFDSDLLNHAKELGSHVLQPAKVLEVHEHEDCIEVYILDENKNKKSFKASYLADASGRDAFMKKRNNLNISNMSYNNHVAIFSHFKNLYRNSGIYEGDIKVGILDEDGWAWSIPFKGEVTSFGFVTNKDTLGKQTKEDFWTSMTEKYPYLKEQFKQSIQLRPLNMISNYSYHCSKLYGKRWLLLGDAGLFLDPLFSSGVHMALKSSQFASEALIPSMDNNEDFFQNNLGKKYEETMRLGSKRFHSLLQFFYDGNFVFKTQVMLNKKKSSVAIVKAVAGSVWDEDNHLFRMGMI